MRLTKVLKRIEKKDEIVNVEGTVGPRAVYPPIAKKNASESVDENEKNGNIGKNEETVAGLDHDLATVAIIHPRVEDVPSRTMMNREVNANKIGIEKERNENEGAEIEIDVSEVGVENEAVGIGSEVASGRRVGGIAPAVKIIEGRAVIRKTTEQSIVIDRVLRISN